MKGFIIYSRIPSCVWFIIRSFTFGLKEQNNNIYYYYWFFCTRCFVLNLLLWDPYLSVSKTEKCMFKPATPGVEVFSSSIIITGIFCSTYLITTALAEFPRESIQMKIFFVEISRESKFNWKWNQLVLQQWQAIFRLRFLRLSAQSRLKVGSWDREHCLNVKEKRLVFCIWVRIQ